jgi:exportin-5
MSHQNGPGVDGVENNGPDFNISNVLHALDLIHNPTTNNDVRREASNYLDHFKHTSDSLQQAFALASDKTRAPLARHYGLSILEHVVRHEEHNLSEEQNSNLRAGILKLGYNVDENEQAHIRNKIAGLWVELAKRSWALDWFGLDEDLLQLWSQDLIHKDFVLTVLENLSEDTFVREDATAVLRGKDLKNALLEIFTASAHFSGGIKIGDSVHHARSSDDGWLVRINEFLLQIRSGVQNKSAKSGALKGLAVIRSVGETFIAILLHNFIKILPCHFQQYKQAWANERQTPTSKSS